MSITSIIAIIIYLIIFILIEFLVVSLRLREKYYDYVGVHGNLSNKFLAHPRTSLLLSYCPRFVRIHIKFIVAILRILLWGIIIYVIHLFLFAIYMLVAFTWPHYIQTL